MIDLHTHSYLSDGVFGPAEHIRRAEYAGYRILGFADHADLATLPGLVPQLITAARRENELNKLKVLAGVELTHVRPAHIAEAANLARELGAEVVLVHGETLAEPVDQGTNRAAIEAGVDILAHPGLITEELAKLAAERNVLLEISGKAGHSWTNGHVALMARKTGAGLIFGSDAHDSAQMPSRPFAEKLCKGAGLTEEEIRRMFENAERFALHKLHQSQANRSADW